MNIFRPSQSDKVGQKSMKRGWY